MALMSLGILAGSLVFGPVVDRFGYQPVLVAGALGVGLGLAAIAWLPTPTLLTPAMLLFGCGGGLLNGATNALVADITPEGRESGLSALGGVFRDRSIRRPAHLGAPLAMDDIHGDRGRTGVPGRRAAGGLRGGAVPAAEAGARVPAAARRGAPGRSAAALGRVCLLFFQSGMEITLGGWSAQYVREVLGLSEERSILVLSLFWVGMVAARLVLTRLLRFQAGGDRVPVVPGGGLRGSGIDAGRAEQSPAAATGLFLLGFGLAAGFPILLGFLGGLYRDLTGTAFSAVFVMALIGGSSLPYLTGVLADRQGLRASLVVVPIGLLAQGALFLLLRRRLGAITTEADLSRT